MTKKLTQLSGVESTKLCIELDKELESKLNRVKAELEDAFEYFGQIVNLTDTELIKSLLYCFDSAIEEEVDTNLTSSLNYDKVGEMHRRKIILCSKKVFKTH